MPTDDELADALAAARGGDERGFAVLWRTLHPGLLRYLRVVAGDAAEDAASETWLQAARDLDRFTGDPADFRGWLFGIARHRGIDERRRAGRRREDPAPAVDEMPPGPDAAAEAIEGAETAWAISRVAALPADQAEAVMLRVVAGLDVAGAAKVLGKRPGAVRIATMRGLRRLATDPQVRERAAPSAASPPAAPPPVPPTAAAPSGGLADGHAPTERRLRDRIARLRSAQPLPNGRPVPPQANGQADHLSRDTATGEV